MLLLSLLTLQDHTTWSGEQVGPDGPPPIVYEMLDEPDVVGVSWHLIPREVLFGNPHRASVRLSPDGQTLAWLAPGAGGLQVHVAPVEDVTAERVLTEGRHRIGQVMWAHDSAHLLYAEDLTGAEQAHVYALDVETGTALDLTPIEGVSATIQQVSPLFPTEILVGLNDRSPARHDVYRVDITTAERVLVEQNDRYLGFVTDNQLQVRLAMRFELDGGVETLVRDIEGAWRPLYTVEMEDSLNTQPVGWDRSGNVLYMRDSRGRDTSALTALDLRTLQEEVLFEDARADLIDALVHPVDGSIQALAVAYTRKEWTVLDPALAAHLETLGSYQDGEIEILSRSADDGRWVVAYARSDAPIQYVLYDTESQAITWLFSQMPALEGQPLVPMHDHVIPARDGLELVTYVSLPWDADPDRDGVPDQALPTVLLVHGGPWARDAWGFNPLHQWLANRGYAVISVNFRGSTGLGKEFLNAGNQEWGGAMQTDLLDAVDWAVDQGITDRDRVGILGASYGGYAALMGLAQTPDVFACGVDMVGPSNLITLLRTVPAYWRPARRMFRDRVGNVGTPWGRRELRAVSPLTYVDDIERPLLIAQGANDPRVAQAESDQIVTAMGERGIPVTYVLYPDEGHGLAHESNRLSFAAVTEVFLQQHLGGVAEPLGDFEGSSITVPAGVELIPGLADQIGVSGDPPVTQP
jgi:dipeptidyl aminopeptidase/acylaminoacyl peptidase